MGLHLAKTTSRHASYLRATFLRSATIVIALLISTSTLIADKPHSPLVITTTEIPTIVAGVPTDVIVRFEASGGIPPYRWVTLDRRPPEGTKLEIETGILSGAAKKPSGDQPYQIFIQVSDSTGHKAAKTLPFKVRPSAALDNSKTRPWYFWLMFMFPGVLLIWFVIRVAVKNAPPPENTIKSSQDEQ